MLRLFFGALIGAAHASAMAALEPGQWEFTSVSTSSLFSKPQAVTFSRCIRKEEAADPERWMSNPGDKTDCKITPGKRTADSYSWRMECPSTKMRGTGSARMNGATMEGESSMTGEAQGKKFDIRTMTTGRRVGPCK